MLHPCCVWYLSSLELQALSACAAEGDSRPSKASFKTGPCVMRAYTGVNEEQG